MNLAYAYPKSRFEPAVLVDLNARAERERLSKSALKGFFMLTAAWQVRDEDARELLGGLSSSTFYEWKKNPDRVLEVDRITRISYLLASTRHCTSCTATSWPTNGSRCRTPTRCLAGAPRCRRCWPAACWRCKPCASCSTRGAVACERACRA